MQQQRRQNTNWVKLIKLALFLIVAGEAIFHSVLFVWHLSSQCIYTLNLINKQTAKVTVNTEIPLPSDRLKLE